MECASEAGEGRKQLKQKKGDSLEIGG